MYLTPVEIQHQPLRGRGRGYDREDVDKLLEHAAASYEQVWLERDELRARVTELESELDSFRDSERFLRKSLVTAERAAHEVRAEAKEEAERIVREALADAERAKSAAEDELEELRAEIERVRSLERDLSSNLRALLHAGLGAIGDGRTDEEAQPSETLMDALKGKPARGEERDG